MLTVSAISYEINKRLLIRDISFQIKQGELLAVLGANGAGKSTLLRMLSGEKKPSTGEIRLFGKCLEDHTSQELAKKRAVLHQQNAISMAFQVEEVVMMGRYPHYKNLPKEADRTAVEETMEVCGITHLADRSFPTLSGGEQQRVQFARVLAQVWDQPHALILMDEPVVGLDLQYQQQTLAIVRALCNKGFMVLAILHEINLAAQYADRILMLKNGRKWKDGTPSEVLTSTNIYTVFNVETEVSIDKRRLRPSVTQKAVKMTADSFNSLLPRDQESTLSLKERRDRYIECNPRAGMEDIARALRVSEATLLAEDFHSSVHPLNISCEELLGKWDVSPLSMEIHGHHCKVYIDLPQALDWLYVDYAQIDQVYLTAFNGLHKLFFFDKEGYTLLTMEINGQMAALLKQSKALAKRNHKGPLPHIWPCPLVKLPAEEPQLFDFSWFKHVITQMVEEGLSLDIIVGNVTCHFYRNGTIRSVIGDGNYYEILGQQYQFRLEVAAVTKVVYMTITASDGKWNCIEVHAQQVCPMLQLLWQDKSGLNMSKILKPTYFNRP